MPGGTFDKIVGKVRPGTYINFESTRPTRIRGRNRGAVTIPLINHPYGPGEEFIRIARNAPEAQRHKLGYSVFDPELLLVREALKAAAEVVVYIPKQGAKATATENNLTVTAKYGGARGNDLRVAVTANPTGGFDVSVWLGSDRVFNVTGLSEIDELIKVGNNDWVDFAGGGALVAHAGFSLSGGVTGNATNADITKYIDSSESQSWDTMAFPIAQAALKAAVASKIKYLRDNGKYRTAAVSGLQADCIGIINVTNGVVLNDGTEIDAFKATAFIAASDAAALYHIESLTYRPYEGAVSILGEKNHEEAEAAINKGEFFFSWNERGEVAVEYDINSLVTFERPKGEYYRKNRVRRTLDSFAKDVMLEFPPNRFHNNEDAWDAMEGLGRELLLRYEGNNAIMNVNFEEDFRVNRGESIGDEVFFDVFIQPVDSAEKLFFTIKTR